MAESRERARRRRWVWVLSLACGLVSHLVSYDAATVRAQELALTRGPSDCRQDAIPREVEAALGRPLADGEPALRARLTMRRRAHDVEVVITLEREGAQSQRLLRAPDCERAMRAAGLVLALALDLDRLEGASNDGAVEAAPIPRAAESPATESPAAESQTPAGAHRDTARAAPRRARQSAISRVVLLAGAIVNVGALPAPRIGPRAGVGLGFGALFRLELDGSYLTPTRAARLAPGARVDIGLGAATIRAAIIAPVTRALRLGGTLAIEVGAATGRGAGIRVQEARRTRLPWAAVRAGAIAELHVGGPLWLRGSCAIGIPFVTPSFAIVGAGEPVRSSASVLGEGALSLVVDIERSP